jgi:rhodanese-related sulfurtransferase
MIGKVLNLPFKVLSSVARAVQAQEAKKWSGHAERDADSARENPGIDISVPEDFDPGPTGINAETAVALLDSGCVVDASDSEPQIPGALHIPWPEIGIRIAELPPATTIAVVSKQPEHSERVVRFLRHRGLDETWSLTGGLSAWINAGGPVGETST